MAYSGKNMNNVVQMRPQKQELLFRCTACGADRGCDCNAPAIEKMLDNRERERQRGRKRRAKSMTASADVTLEKLQESDLAQQGARSLFLMNCDTARSIAIDYWGPVDAGVIRNCEAVIQRWNELLDRLQKEFSHGEPQG